MAALKPDIMKLADAVVAELNGNQSAFSMPFVAVRKMLVEQKVEELEQVRVFVVPEAIEAERLDRKQMARDARVSIGVVRRLKAVPTDIEIGQIVELTEQIVDRFTNTTHRLTIDADAGLAATVMGFDWDPLYWPPYIRQFNQVTCVPVIAWQFYR